MKKILNHLKSDWYRYGFETLVVTIGILGAFTLNNWNEERKSKVKSNIYVNKLAADIIADTVNITKLMERSSENRSRIEVYFEFFETHKVPLNVYIDSPKNVKWNLFRYLPKNHTFEDMISSGNLHLLSEDQRQSLMELSNDQEFTQIIIEKRITAYFGEMAQSKKYLDWDISNSRFFEVISLKQDKEKLGQGLLHLHNILTIIHKLHGDFIWRGEVIKQQSIKTLKFLDVN